MQTLVPRSLALFLAAFLVGALLLACYALYIESQAWNLLKDLTSLNSGRSTGAQAQDLARKYHRWVFQASDPCTENECTVSFRIQNTWLSKLKLESQAMFHVDVSVRNGLVDSIGALLFRAMPIFPTFQGSAGDVTETVEIPSRFHTAEHYFFPTPVGKPYLAISVDTHATPIQRQRAFDFSFRCLVKPGGGCDLPCDYLPSAWQDWKASLFSAGWSAQDFEQRYPNNARCRGTS
jgi:hypothetical protein